MNELFQEVTGIDLHTEYEGHMDMQECGAFRDHVQDLMSEDKTGINIIEPFYELYFSSPELVDNERQQSEQFYISVNGSKEHPTIHLKKKCNIDGYYHEDDTKLTKNQYKKLLQGKYEWMKQAGELLIQEFYQKIKLFRYRVSMVKKGIRESFFLKDGKLQIFLDYCCKTLFYEGFGLMNPTGTVTTQDIAFVQIKNLEGNRILRLN